MPEAITLEPNALYITTHLQGQGVFHWSLISTDHNASASKHHWFQHTVYSGQGPIERYGSQPLNRYPAQPADILGYFKISGFLPLAPKDFTGICESVFSASCSTKDANRAKGINSRTWVFEVLGILCARGYIQSRTGLTPPSLLKSLESQVIRQSTLADNAYLRAFLGGTSASWKPVVMNV